VPLSHLVSTSQISRGLEVDLYFLSRTPFTMDSSIPQLVTSTQELEEILARVENASSMFSNPDPAVRSQGENIFLHVRQSSIALEFACFALCECLSRLIRK